MSLSQRRRPLRPRLLAAESATSSVSQWSSPDSAARWLFLPNAAPLASAALLPLFIPSGSVRLTGETVCRAVTRCWERRSTAAVEPKLPFDYTVASRARVVVDLGPPLPCPFPPPRACLGPLVAPPPCGSLRTEDVFNRAVRRFCAFQSRLQGERAAQRRTHEREQQEGGGAERGAEECVRVQLIPRLQRCQPTALSLRWACASRVVSWGRQRNNNTRHS